MNIASLLFISFILLAAANIISVKKSSNLGKCLTKPLLMPILLILYLFGASSPKWSVILALVSGFLGDISLMKSGIFFTIGLFSFLIGHIFYIISFLGPVSFSKIPSIFYILILPYILCGTLIYRRFLPYLKSMKFQALLYIIIIMAMSFSSLTRIWSTSSYHFWLPFIGSILFIASDTLLAFNEFKTNVVSRDVYIMLTYITAQLLIVLGFII